MSRIDLHTHSTASDGTDSPEALMERALAAGVAVLALTDHDTLAGVRRARERVPEGLRLIPGVELSCRGRGGRCHILGLGVDPESPALRAPLDALAKLRREKLERRLAYLTERGMALPPAEREALRALPSAGKPHLAGLLVSCGYVPNRRRAFEVLGECETGEDRLDAGTAVVAILDAGGVPVWAHPRGGVDGAVGEREFRALLPELISYGLGGLECFYSMYPMALCRELAAEAGERGLLVSAGSDFHGGNKSVELGRLTAGGGTPRREEITVLDRLL